MKTMIFRRDWLVLMLTMSDEAAGVFIKEIAAFTLDPTEEREIRIKDSAHRASFKAICKQLVDSYNSYLAKRAFDDIVKYTQ